MTSTGNAFQAICIGGLLALSPGALRAEGPSAGAPLSVIDWLGTRPLKPAAEPAALPLARDEPPVTRSATVPDVSVAPIGTDAPRAIGLVPGGITGLPADLWSGSEMEDVVALISGLPTLNLPAAQSLLFTVLLAEAHAPKGAEGSGETVIMSSNKAISTYREQAPTGAGGLPAVSSQEGGS